MERALVVLDDTETHRELLAEAAEITEGVGASLELFSWVTPDEFEQDVEALEAAGQAEGTSFSDTNAEDIVRNFIDEMAEDVFGADAPDYDISAAVSEDSELADSILEAAREGDCDHIFLVGRRRSPTGKVLFGDVAQQVILNFEGHVTITMG